MNGNFAFWASLRVLRARTDFDFTVYRLACICLLGETVGLALSIIDLGAREVIGVLVVVVLMVVLLGVVLLVLGKTPGELHLGSTL